MKGQRQPVALSQGHRPSGVNRQDLRLAGRLHHLGGADEYRRAAAPDGRRFHLRLEAVDLAAVGVALHGHVDQAQRLLVRAPVHDPVRHQDHAGAGSEPRHALGAAGYDRLPQAGLHQPRHGGALTARKDQRVDPVHIGAQAHRPALDLAGAQRRHVLAETPLQGQDADKPAGRPRAHQPLPASSSSCGIAPISSPRIGLPRLLEASARMSGRSKYVVAATIALARADGFSDLKIPDPTKTPSQPSCIIRAASAGVASPPAAKLTTGRRPNRAHSSSRPTGAPIRLASMTSSSGPAPWRRRMAEVTARTWRTASTTLPVPASPLVRIMAAPSAIRRSASPRSLQPQTKGTLKGCLLMWCSSSAGVSTSLSSM